MRCHQCGTECAAGVSFCAKCGAKVSASGVNQNISSFQSAAAKNVSRRHKKLGVLFIVLPAVTVVTAMLIWAMIIFIKGQMPATSEVTLGTSMLHITQWILGSVALLAMAGSIVLVPLGIIFLLTKTERSDVHFDDRSGKGEASIVPPEIHGFSWGAAGLTWIWGLSNSVPLSFLIFVPFVGCVWWIVLGVKGNEWAWKATPWVSVEQFKDSQRTWGKWGLAVFIFNILLIVFSTIYSAINGGSV